MAAARSIPPAPVGTIDLAPTPAYVTAYARETTVSAPRTASLFRNGRNQAVRIPVEFELPGNEVIIRKEGDRLILEPRQKKTLLDVLDEMEPLTKEEWPDIDDSDVAPDDDVEL
jgi:antitoxin VapB